MVIHSFIVGKPGEDWFRPMPTETSFSTGHVCPAPTFSTSYSPQVTKFSHSLIISGISLVLRPLFRAPLRGHVSYDGGGQSGSPRLGDSDDSLMHGAGGPVGTGTPTKWPGWFATPAPYVHDMLGVRLRTTRRHRPSCDSQPVGSTGIDNKALPSTRCGLTRACRFPTVIREATRSGQTAAR